MGIGHLIEHIFFRWVQCSFLLTWLVGAMLNSDSANSIDFLLL